MEKYQAASKKKDKAKTADAYNKAKTLLEDYLDAVELPPALEISQS